MTDKRDSTAPIGTRDIDSLLPRKIPEISKTNISKHLHNAGFTQLFKDFDSPPTESYVKVIRGIEVEIEFLTDSSTRSDKNKNVVISGVSAQPLSYLTLSLETTMEFTTNSGERGFVVSPGAWMFHKGLTFPKRKSSQKVFKDLYGIWYVSSQLGGFSETAVSEFHALGRVHTKWYKTFQHNLLTWLENSSPLEWSQLESQDPFGNLKRLSFEKTLILNEHNIVTDLA